MFSILSNCHSFCDGHCLTVPTTTTDCNLVTQSVSHLITSIQGELVLAAWSISSLLFTLYCVDVYQLCILLVLASGHISPYLADWVWSMMGPMFCSHNGAFYELFRFQTRLPCPELVCAVGDDVTVKQRCYHSPVSGPRFASDLQHLSGLVC